MDLYHKSTNTQRCLQNSTSHPKHCLKNIPFVLARRICTIVENNNQNNPKIFYLAKSGVNAVVENNVNGFKKIRLIHGKQQPPNIKRVLTNSLFTNKAAGVFKSSDRRCLSCQQLLLGISYTFKNTKPN